MVFKIPPAYEHSTTSNIPFEKGGVFTVSKPCNRQPHQSSASRGVRSWPPEVESSKMDTVPLLTPTMECELLKEPWVFPQPNTNVRKEDERAASPSTWEENFQDLSSWCTDTFQGQCDFRTGESATLKLSGTKYEGNSVLSSEEGVLKDLMSVTDEKKWSMKMTTAETNEHLNNNSHSLQTTSITSKYNKDDSAAESNAPNTWLKLSRGSIATVNTSSGSKQSNADVSTPFQSRYQIEDVDMNDARPISFDSTENQREMWDMLRTVETTGSDTFDLLSYLCNDELRSPEGSVSTDSSIVSKPWSPVKSSATIPQTSVKVKTEKKKTASQECTKNRAAASTITSSSIETPVLSTRSTERTRKQVTTSKAEKTYNRVRREKSGRKRYIEPEPEDRTFALHYRESREKNNEASRKSRMNKKAKENEMSTMAIELERDNRILKMKVEELEKLVTSMRSALLRSALKKEL